MRGLPTLRGPPPNLCRNLVGSPSPFSLASRRLGPGSRQCGVALIPASGNRSLNFLKRSVRLPHPPPHLLRGLSVSGGGQP